MLGLPGKESRWTIKKKYSSSLFRNLWRLGLGLRTIRFLEMSATCPAKADEEKLSLFYFNGSESSYLNGHEPNQDKNFCLKQHQMSVHPFQDNHIKPPQDRFLSLHPLVNSYLTWPLFKTSVLLNLSASLSSQTSKIKFNFKKQRSCSDSEISLKKQTSQNTKMLRNPAYNPRLHLWRL